MKIKQLAYLHRMCYPFLVCDESCFTGHINVPQAVGNANYATSCIVRWQNFHLTQLSFFGEFGSIKWHIIDQLILFSLFFLL